MFWARNYYLRFNEPLIAPHYFAAMPRKLDPNQFPNFERAQRERGPFAKIGDLKLVSSKTAKRAFLITILISAFSVFIVVFLVA
jgi:hypothetical protein